MTASPPPAGPRTQEIAVPPVGSAPADPAAHGATAVGTAPEHPPHAAPAPLPPPAYPHTAPQPAHAEAATAVVSPAGTGAAAPPQPTGPLDSFFGSPPPPPPPAAPAEVTTAAAPAAEAPSRRTAARTPRAPRTPRDRAVLITTGLGVVGLVLLELGLTLRLGGQVLWSDLPLWSAFATLAALTGVVGLAASLLPGGKLRPAVAERLAVGGLAGLAVFWVLIALPRVDSDRGFLLTAALGALAVAVWLAPARRRG
ncbi:hypothetical protein SAMN04488107_3738 [Geodermatophilus saharensis]|uniref:Uncharacterized protein n=1 Tax=Geodermatophilus saharensis TaxID=1137994 RepID=A0A239H9R9_9ACTN|nr:hypothetical protein [Geodermatophilus saharensis]SNS77563.1 hypothetical protein SAMN04488107_3738 [Geodermatophilus saharensis]